MNRTNKILAALLVILSIIVASLFGLFLYNRNIDQRVEQSREELADIPDRIIPPQDNIDTDSEPVVSNNDNIIDTTELEDEINEPAITIDSPQNTNSTPAEEPVADQGLTNNTPVENNPPADNNEVLLQSNWNSVRSYRTSGGVNITKTGSGISLNFESDFSFSGAPDPVVYLCKDKEPNSINNCLVVGALQANRGSQSWSIIESEFNEYPNPVLWCRAFGLLMGHID